MTKQETLEAARRGEGCLGRSQDDEPVFVLTARDRIGAQAVRAWAHIAAAHDVDAGKVRGAFEVADRMDAWRGAHGGGKVPD